MTNKNYTAPTAAPPGSYKHYALGWGSSLSSNWFVDVAAEYYAGSGSSKKQDLGSGRYIDSVKTKSTSEVYVGFLSLNRRF